LRWLAGFALSVVFLAITLSRIDGALVVEALRDISLPLPGVALLLVLGEIAVRAYRWQLLLGPIAQVPIRRAYEYICIGHFANTLLPARLGDAARAYLAGGAFLASRLAVLGTILAERVSDGIFILMVVTVAVVAGSPELAPLALGAAALVALGGILLAAVTISVTRTRAAPTRAAGWVRRIGGRLLDGGQALRSPGNVARLALATAASFAAAVVIFDLTARAVGLSFAPWQSAIIIGAASLSTAVPAGPGSLGTYEFVGVTTMTSMGVNPERAFVAIALVHVLITIPPAVIGLLATWRRHLAIQQATDLGSVDA
jgi:uncharacterized membrane protein YbhN (UPF0104 family)